MDELKVFVCPNDGTEIDLTQVREKGRLPCPGTCKMLYTLKMISDLKSQLSRNRQALSS